MTSIAKIALIGNEVVITKYALEFTIKNSNMTQEQAKIYSRVIQKIVNAENKTRKEQERAIQEQLI